MRVVKQNVLTLCMSLCATVGSMTAGAVPVSVVSNIFTDIGLKVESIFENNLDVIANSEKKTKAANIDKYFASMNLPLAGYGEAFVETAEKYDLDYRLLPAIAMRESTGGKFACYNDDDNVFGWHSCSTTFTSQESAIDKVGEHLAGEIKSTKSYYRGKSVRKKLRTYNSVIPPYVDQVISIMNKIEKIPVYESLAKVDKNDLKDIAVK